MLLDRLRPVVLLQQHLSWCRQASSMVQSQLNNAHSPAYVAVLTKTNRLVALGRGYIGARTDTTQQSGQTPDKKVEIKNITVYVSSYTETPDSRGR